MFHTVVRRTKLITWLCENTLKNIKTYHWEGRRKLPVKQQLQWLSQVKEEVAGMEGKLALEVTFENRLFLETSTQAPKI